MEEKQTLRELVRNSNHIVETLIESGGELTPEMEALIQNVEVQLPAKIDGYCMLMDRLELEEEWFKQKAEEYRTVARVCANDRDRLKDALKQAAIELKMDELVGNEKKIKISNSKPRLVIDINAIDRSYMTQVITYEVDKKKIEEDLKLGVPVEGAYFEETKALRISINKKALK